MAFAFAAAFAFAGEAGFGMTGAAIIIVPLKRPPAAGFSSAGSSCPQWKQRAASAVADFPH
jgi:hypothetical protein